MPIPHPRRRVGGGGLLLEPMGPVREWAPPGWYWEVLPSGRRNLVRSQPIVDPDVSWWWSHGPWTIQRLESPAEVVLPCQQGERARPSLHGSFGGQVRQYLADSSRISLELCSCDASFSLGVHRPPRYPSGTRVLARSIY